MIMLQTTRQYLMDCELALQFKLVQGGNMKMMKKEKGNGCEAKTIHWGQSPALWHIKNNSDTIFIGLYRNQEDKYDWN